MALVETVACSVVIGIGISLLLAIAIIAIRCIIWAVTAFDDEEFYLTDEVGK